MAEILGSVAAPYTFTLVFMSPQEGHGQGHGEQVLHQDRLAVQNRSLLPLLLHSVAIAALSAPECSAPGTRVYWERTAGRRLHALAPQVATGVVYVVHHCYLVLGQDCTCAATAFLGEPYAFHTCSRNTINTRTVVLYIAQFGLEIEILFSHLRN